MGLAAVAVCVGGCGASKKKQMEQWVPPPRVEEADVSVDPVPFAENAFIPLDVGRTEGRFPSTLSVSRVAAVESLDPCLSAMHEINGAESSETGRDSVPDAGSAAALDRARRLDIPATPLNEFLVWNSAFDDLPAVVESFPVVSRDLLGYDPSAERVLQAAGDLGATLSLVYAVNIPAPHEYEMFGILYETATARPLAAIHTHQISLPAPEDRQRAENNVDAWSYEARALARCRFVKLVHDGLRDMIARDEPKQVEVPEGWIRKTPPIAYPNVFPQH